MGLVVVVLLLALALAAAVMLYAAYPYRGEETPVTPVLGQVLRRGVASLPTIDPQADRRAEPDLVDVLGENAKVEAHS